MPFFCIVSHFSLGKQLTVVTSEFGSAVLCLLIFLSLNDPQKKERCTGEMVRSNSPSIFSECQTFRMPVLSSLISRPITLHTYRIFSGMYSGIHKYA